MLLLLEIWLTVAAWRAGWKATALLPTGAAIAVGILLGASGVEVSQNLLLYALGDIVAVVALGIMAAIGHNKHVAQEPVAEHVSGVIH